MKSEIVFSIVFATVIGAVVAFYTDRQLKKRYAEVVRPTN